MNREGPQDYPHYSLVQSIKQSPPIDASSPYEAAWLRGKTALITGGASGFGAGFAKKWAASGANVIIGDINEAAANKVVKEIRSETGNVNVHFVKCNVTDWQSQVDFFKAAVKLSPHGGIDIVVANAGVAGVDEFEMPQKLDAEEPPKPNLRTVDVNLTGVLYTTHLALFWLPRNPGSKESSITTHPKDKTRDRHLMLMGSMASLGPIPAQPLYAVAKHGVVGLFRTLRATSFVHGVRVNIICPYFIDTPILPASARAALAGGGVGKPEDVVDAGTRVAADTRIMGRSLYIGPKMTVVQDDEGNYELALQPQSVNGVTQAIWEAYAHDYEDSELFGRNIVRLLNAFTRARGRIGWVVDLFQAAMFGARSMRRRLFNM